MLYHISNVIGIFVEKERSTRDNDVQIVRPSPRSRGMLDEILGDYWSETRNLKRRGEYCCNPDGTVFVRNDFMAKISK